MGFILFKLHEHWSILQNVIFFTPTILMIMMSLVRFKKIRESRRLTNISVSLTLIPFIICFGNILINERPKLMDSDRYDILTLLVSLIGLIALPIALQLERKNKHNQEMERTVKTPAD